MGRPEKAEKKTAQQATNPEPEIRHDVPQADGAVQDEAHVSDAGALENATDLSPIGPEDFARHDGARLVRDHAADLELLETLEARVRKRGNVIAEMLSTNGPNATIRIGTKDYVARTRPEKHGGGMLLAEVKPRVAVSFGG